MANPKQIQHKIGFFKCTYRDATNMPNILAKYVYFRALTEEEIILQLKTMCSKLGVLEAITITKEEYEENVQ
jgi:hypothetical protein